MEIKNKWHDCDKELPELGQKVLCFKSGDIYTAYHFDGFFFCFPFGDHKFSSDFLKPEKWQKIDFPDGFHGKVDFIINGVSLNSTEYKALYPDSYEEMVNRFLKTFGYVEV